MHAISTVPSPRVGDDRRPVPRALAATAVPADPADPAAVAIRAPRGRRAAARPGRLVGAVLVAGYLLGLAALHADEQRTARDCRARGWHQAYAPGGGRLVCVPPSSTWPLDDPRMSIEPTAARH